MIEQPQFKSGDNVQYRGEGPMMRVLSTSSSLCYCKWTDDLGRVQHGTFEEANLTGTFSDSELT